MRREVVWRNGEALCGEVGGGLEEELGVMGGLRKVEPVVLRKGWV